VAGGVEGVGPIAVERSSEPERERRLLASDGGADDGRVDARVDDGLEVGCGEDGHQSGRLQRRLRWMG
jgi:hypothetical protein